MLRPHYGKDLPTLAAFMSVKGGKAGRDAQTLDIDTAMRRWVAVTAAAQAQRARRPKP